MEPTCLDLFSALINLCAYMRTRSGESRPCVRKSDGDRNAIVESRSRPNSDLQCCPDVRHRLRWPRTTATRPRRP
jgi:hypothetical protein